MSRRTPRRSTRPLHRRLFPFILALLALLTTGLLIKDLFKPPQETMDRRMVGEGATQTSQTLTSENAPRTITEGDATITLETGAEVRVVRDGHKPAREIELRRGSIRVQVKPVPGGRFIVRTFNATVGVRGTTFRVSVVGFFVTRVLVEEGKVFVQGQTGTEILLGAGQSGEVMGGDAAAEGGPGASNERNSNYPTWNAETMRRVTELAEALERSEREAQGISLPAAGRGLSPDLTATSRNRLIGTGDWTADNGLAGQITLNLEPLSGSFTGTLSGQRTGEKPLTIRGNVQGTLTGDADNGSLDGKFTVTAEQSAAGVALPPISGEATGTIRNHLVTGTLNAGSWRGSYEVRLQ